MPAGKWRAIVYRGLADGNMAVFDSKYTTSQIFKDAGIGGIEAVYRAEMFGLRDDEAVQTMRDGYRHHHFRQAILDSDPGLGLGSRMTETNVVGWRIRFSGIDIGDPDQRMNFVNTIADTFMARYNQPDGRELIRRFYLSRGIN